MKIYAIYFFTFVIIVDCAMTSSPKDRKDMAEGGKEAIEGVGTAGKSSNLGGIYTFTAKDRSGRKEPLPPTKEFDALKMLKIFSQKTNLRIQS